MILLSMRNTFICYKISVQYHNTTKFEHEIPSVSILLLLVASSVSISLLFAPLPRSERVNEVQAFYNKKVIHILPVKIHEVHVAASKTQIKTQRARQVKNRVFQDQYPLSITRNEVILQPQRFLGPQNTILVIVLPQDLYFWYLVLKS